MLRSAGASAPAVCGLAWSPATLLSPLSLSNKVCRYSLLQPYVVRNTCFRFSLVAQQARSGALTCTLFMCTLHYARVRPGAYRMCIHIDVCRVKYCHEVRTGVIIKYTNCPAPTHKPFIHLALAVRRPAGNVLPRPTRRTPAQCTAQPHVTAPEES